MLQIQICYHSHLNVSQKTKTNTNFRGEAWFRPQQIALSRALCYPICTMPQISTKDSGILQLTKNAKTNNNIAGYHLVSRRVISATSDVQCVYRSPKRSFILPKNFHVSVTNMLSQLVKYVIKKKTTTNFRDQTW